MDKGDQSSKLSENGKNWNFDALNIAINQNFKIPLYYLASLKDISRDQIYTSMDL